MFPFSLHSAFLLHATSLSFPIFISTFSFTFSFYLQPSLHLYCAYTLLCAAFNLALNYAFNFSLSPLFNFLFNFLSNWLSTLLSTFAFTSRVSWLEGYPTALVFLEKLRVCCEQPRTCNTHTHTKVFLSVTKSVYQNLFELRNSASSSSASCNFPWLEFKRRLSEARGS